SAAIVIIIVIVVVQDAVVVIIVIVIVANPIAVSVVVIPTVNVFYEALRGGLGEYGCLCRGLRGQSRLRQSDHRQSLRSADIKRRAHHIGSGAAGQCQSQCGAEQAFGRLMAAIGRAAWPPLGQQHERNLTDNGEIGAFYYG
ncbi:MAG: hypothetical protein HC779_04015, partial [Phyllobacteriaceae bacterium]|nr:hypothetical protein [Phyllobacteriaceae bacterium]